MANARQNGVTAGQIDQPGAQVPTRKSDGKSSARELDPHASAGALEAQGSSRVELDVQASTRELAILELGAQNEHELSAAPIPGSWILEGAPVARNKLLAGSTDGMASTYMWDCTAGRFNWFYDIDETICLLEGSVLVSCSTGESRRLTAGDTFFFPHGSRAEWTVDTYVRKIAFIHIPMSRKMRLIKRALAALVRLVWPGAGKDKVPTSWAPG